MTRQCSSSAAATTGTTHKHIHLASEQKLTRCLLSVPSKPLTLDHWTMLGVLARCGSLNRLDELIINGDDDGDEGVVLLSAGLRRGGLPSLSNMYLANAHIGPKGAAALAAASTSSKAGSLQYLGLATNHIGDEGLAILAPALQ